MTSFLPRTLICSAILCLSLPAAVRAAADTQFSEKRSENDFEALRRWLNDKRMVTLKELGGDLSLSGDARVEFRDNNQTNNCMQQYGSNGATKKPAQAWAVKANLMMDYRTEFTWSALKVEFNNTMGTRSGTTDKISVKKAYLGGRFLAGDTFTWDGEIGRRNFNNVYDSKVEFRSLFDGVMFRLSKAFESIGNFYFNPGAFLVDDKFNHYGYAAEIGGLQIGNCGLGMKYSVIDWKKHFPNALKDRRYNFIVQQFTVLYQFNPNWIGKRLIKLYAAGISNMIAHHLRLPEDYVYVDGVATYPHISVKDKKNLGYQNWGWYAGVAIGQVKKQGDFAIEADYQWVQAQTVPEYDFSGIGRGNAAEAGLVTTKLDGSGNYTNVNNAVGPCNYKGFEVDVLYAFTSNLTVDQNFKYSTTLNKQIGPNIKYKQMKVEFIYAF